LTGPKGDPGPIGQPGSDGAQGPKGDKGDPGVGGAINLPTTWTLNWTNLDVGNGGIVVDASHPYEAMVSVRLTVPDTSGAYAECWLLVSSDGSNWQEADMCRFQRQGSAGQGSWVSDCFLKAQVAAGWKLAVSLNTASGGTVSQGAYNLHKRRKLD
jgi:hypothetical protein